MNSSETLRLLRSLAYRYWYVEEDRPGQIKNLTVAKLERRLDVARELSVWGDVMLEEIKVIVDEVLNEKDS